MMNRKGRAINDNDSGTVSARMLLIANISAVHNTRLISVFPGALRSARGCSARDALESA